MKGCAAKFWPILLAPSMAFEQKGIIIVPRLLYHRNRGGGGFIRGTTPLSRLVRQARGTEGPTPTRVPWGPVWGGGGK